VLVLQHGLGALDYRVPDGLDLAPGDIVRVPLGPRQIAGVVWEPDRLPAKDVPDAKLRAVLGRFDVARIEAPLRRLVEWVADYYLAPPSSVLRMAISSHSALEGARIVTEYRATGLIPDKLTPQRARALERISVDMTGDEPKTVFLGSDGKPNAELNAEKISQEFVANPAYKAIIIASKATGGGAPARQPSIKPLGGGTPQGEQNANFNAATAKPGELVERIKAKKAAQAQQ